MYTSCNFHSTNVSRFNNSITYPSILSPLLNHSVKECQGVDQRFEGRMRAAFLQSSWWNLKVGVPQIQLQTIGRFCHNFQRSLHTTTELTHYDWDSEMQDLLHHGYIVRAAQTWSIPIGNSGVGAVVSQSLKSGWGLVIFSRAFSSSLSQRISRWQFCNISQCPRVDAVSKSWRAT